MFSTEFLDGSTGVTVRTGPSDTTVAYPRHALQIDPRQKWCRFNQSNRKVDWKMHRHHRPRPEHNPNLMPLTFETGQNQSGHVAAACLVHIRLKLVTRIANLRRPYVTSLVCGPASEYR